MELLFVVYFQIQECFLERNHSMAVLEWNRGMIPPWTLICILFMERNHPMVFIFYNSHIQIHMFYIGFFRWIYSLDLYMRLKKNMKET
jgi:hypothetical protein